jgi:hypothetical protein
VYVTIARLPCGHVSVCATATTADPPTLPDRATAACTAPLCPPEQVDRTTGTIRAIHHVMNVERGFAAAVAATGPALNLAGPVAGVLAHPGIGRLLVVGPFDDEADLDRWWHWHGNRLATTGIACLPIALDATPADTSGDAR